MSDRKETTVHGDTAVCYLKSAIAYAAIGDRRSAQFLTEIARNVFRNELGSLSASLQAAAEWNVSND